MGHKGWSAADKAAFKEGVAWAVNASKRKNEKVDLSHMVAYIYAVSKRVEKAVKLFTPTKFCRHPIVSRALSSGKTYGGPSPFHGECPKFLCR